MKERSNQSSLLKLLREQEKTINSLTLENKILRAKSQFLPFINHELRTPLTGIISLLDLLKQQELSAAEKKNILNNIGHCTKHLLSLVNEISDFNRLENGKYVLRHQKVNLNSVLKEVYKITNPLAQKKRIELKFKIESDLPPSLFTDAKILRQILINLVSNAIKFTNHGFVALHLKKLNCADNKIKLAMSVKDTGIGIPAEKLNLIFEPFMQLENVDHRQSSAMGTGLGLSIVEKLATLLGAKLKVKSQLGKGSTFTLISEFKTSTLENKIEIFNPHPKEKILKPKKISSPIFKKPKILLIEDDPIVQYVHKKMFTELGCHIDIISRGSDVLAKLKDHDMIFVDLSLPDISGFEVIKLIRKNVQNTHLPIVALTAYTSKNERTVCLNAGANEFISKPIHHSHLQKLLLRYSKFGSN